METPKQIEVHRLCDLDGWEFYQVAEAGSENVVCTIGLQLYSEQRQAEYEVWDGSAEEPRGRGEFDLDELWDDSARKRVLWEILSTECAELVNTGSDVQILVSLESHKLGE